MTMASITIISHLIAAFLGFIILVQTAYAVIPHVPDSSQSVSNFSDQRYNDDNKTMVGVDLGIHSPNFANSDKFESGLSLRVTVLSLSISSKERIQLAATYSHGKISKVRDTWSSEGLPISIKSEANVDITGAELLYRFTADRDEHLIWSIGPHLSLDHTSYRQAYVVALGFASQLEYIPSNSLIGYQLRLDGKATLFPVRYIDRALPYIMGQVSIGVILMISSID